VALRTFSLANRFSGFSPPTASARVPSASQIANHVSAIGYWLCSGAVWTYSYFPYVRSYCPKNRVDEGLLRRDHPLMACYDTSDTKPITDWASPMRFVIPFLLLLLAGCQAALPVHTRGMNLSEAERTQLSRKATEGDAAAAWRLYHYYSLELHDASAADPWLRRAAELKHPQAQRLLAYLIKDYKRSPDGFGANAPAAVRGLLEQSAQTEGDACYELASAYAEGYFGTPNPSKARAYFQQGAGFHNRMCWKELSHYYRQGIGGPRDDAEAYYWIGLETRCADPRSVSGQESWQAREEIASHLSLPVLEREWSRIDAFVREVTARKLSVDFAPFLSGMIDPKLEAEGRKFSQQREDDHRRKWTATNAQKSDGADASPAGS